MKTHYKVEIRWSDEDDVFLAHVPELDLTTHGNTQVQAAKMAEEAIELHLQTLKDMNVEPPVAAADRNFNGQLPLRLGKSRHQDLFIRASKQGLSMNEYVLNLIDREQDQGDSEPSEYKVSKPRALKVQSPTAAKKLTSTLAHRTKKPRTTKKQAARR